MSDYGDYQFNIGALVAVMKTNPANRDAAVALLMNDDNLSRLSVIAALGHLIENVAPYLSEDQATALLPQIKLAAQRSQNVFWILAAIDRKRTGKAADIYYREVLMVGAKGNAGFKKAYAALPPLKTTN